MIKISSVGSDSANFQNVYTNECNILKLYNYDDDVAVFHQKWMIIINIKNVYNWDSYILKHNLFLENW